MPRYPNTKPISLAKGSCKMQIQRQVRLYAIATLYKTISNQQFHPRPE